MTVGEVVDKAKSLKTSIEYANSVGNYEEALNTLQEAISLLQDTGGDWLDATTQEPEPPADLDLPFELVDHLADIIGMAGGTLRRKKLYAEALQAYITGSAYELNEKYKIQKSYNAVNAIKMQLLSEETTLREPDELTPEVKKIMVLLMPISSGNVLEVDDVINLIIEQVKEGIGVRREDRWAWADLGDCYLLKGNSSEEAKKAYQNFKDRSDNKSLVSAYRVLQEMAEHFKNHNDPREKAVRDVIELLKEKMGVA